LLWRHKKALNDNSKIILYESFVRCHLTYGLSIWGGSKPIKLKPLEKTLSKIWRKIGENRMHTNDRLRKYKILKLNDEIKIQEQKVVWKWEKKKIPKSLNSLIEEKNDRLRGRRFNLIRNSKQLSIHSRLTKIANSSMNEITKFSSLEALSSNLKKSALDHYDTTCRTRNCYICSNRSA
jgi:hypothetical protein